MRDQKPGEDLDRRCRSRETGISFVYFEDLAEEEVSSVGTSLVTLLWVVGARLPTEYLDITPSAEIRVGDASTILEYRLLTAAEKTIEALKSVVKRGTKKARRLNRVAADIGAAVRAASNTGASWPPLGSTTPDKINPRFGYFLQHASFNVEE